MALQTSDYFRDIAERFVDKFPVAFGHIDINQMLFLEETEKKPKKYADIKKVGYPYNSLMNHRFIVTFYTKNVENMTPTQHNILMYNQLLHIDENFEKLKGHDLKDFKQIVAAFGVNWDTNDKVEDILDQDELPEVPSE